MPTICHKKAATTATLIALFAISAPSQASTIRFAFKGELDGSTQVPGDWSFGNTPISGWVEIDTAYLNNTSTTASGGCAEKAQGKCLESAGTSYAPLVRNFELYAGDLSFISFTSLFSIQNYYNTSSISGETVDVGSSHGNISVSSISYQRAYSAKPDSQEWGLLTTEHIKYRDQYFGLNGYFEQLSTGDYTFSGNLNFSQIMIESWGCVTPSSCATTDFFSWFSDGGRKYHPGFFTASATLSEFYEIPEPNVAALVVVGLGGISISRRRLLRTKHLA